MALVSVLGGKPGGLKSWILPPSLVSEAGGMMGSPNLVPGPGNAEVTVLHPTDSRDLATLSPGASGTERALSCRSSPAPFQSSLNY